jgi:hypothetical protein
MRLLVPLLLAVGCTGGGSTYGYQGLKMSPYFPMDGERQAEYANEDVDNVPWKLEVEKVDETETSGSTEIVTWEQYRDDTAELVGAVKWSADSSDGIQIHAYAVGTDDFTVFDPPIAVSDNSDYMNRGDSVVTETGGMTFTSTFVEVVDCPVQWGLDWEDCVHMRIDDGDGDDTVGPIFAGDYWLVTRYGPAWMHTTGYDDKWNLAHYDWSNEAG